MTSQITSLTIVYSTVYSGTDQRKHQSSASLAFVREIHRWPANSPHKLPVTRKMFPLDDVIMYICGKTTPEGDGVIVIGDTNFSSTEIRFNICDVYGLKKIFKDPTCHKGPVSTLFWCYSCIKRYIDKKVDISDHYNTMALQSDSVPPTEENL